MAITLGENAYTTVQAFKDWATLRLLDFYSYNDLEIESAIVTTSVDYIDANYQFIGHPVETDQLMKLPTNDVAISDIANGVHQAVWMQLRGVLFTPDSNETTGEVVSESKQIGELSKSVTYSEGSSKSYTFNTTKIDRLLSPFTISGSGGLGLLRG